MTEKPSKLNSLTGLRFLAAAGIVLLHSGWFGMKAHLVVDLGQFVDLFFLLSGFILAYNYPRLVSRSSRCRFLLARFSRIWPAHALALLLMVLLYRHPTERVHGLSRGVVALINLAMLHSWIPVRNLVFSFNSPSWSISTEFGFYILFLLLIPNWERTWHVKLLIACLLPFALPPLLCLTGIPAEAASGEVLSADWLVDNPLTRVWQFAMGMSAALIWKHVHPRLQVFGTIKGTLLEFVAVALVAASMYKPLGQTMPNVLGPLVGDLGVMLVYRSGPFMVLILVLASECGFVSRLLGSWIAVLLGEISYTIYILHFVLIHYYSEHFQAFAKLPGWLAYCVFWVILLIVCHFIYAGFERPVRNWLLNLWPKTAQDDVRPGLPSLPAAPKTLWQRLAQPNRRLLAGEALVLCCLLSSVAIYATRIR